MKEIGTFTIPADHASLCGHFPEYPVVPGVVLLDHACALALPGNSSAQALAIGRVKFLRPVFPGQPVRVSVSDGNEEGRFTVRCRVDDELALDGTITATRTDSR